MAFLLVIDVLRNPLDGMMLVFYIWKLIEGL
jgi:hypothetical protein